MNALTRVGEVVKPRQVKALLELGGGAGGTLLGYHYLSSEVDWFQEGEYAWLKRGGIIGGGAIVGGHLLFSRSMPMLGWGFKAGGLLIALWEIYQRFFSGPAVSGTSDVAAAADAAAKGTTGSTKTIGRMLDRIGRFMPIPGDGADRRLMSGTQGRRVGGTVAVRGRMGASLAEQAAARI